MNDDYEVDENDSNPGISRTLDDIRIMIDSWMQSGMNAKKARSLLANIRKKCVLPLASVVSPMSLNESRLAEELSQVVTEKDMAYANTKAIATQYEQRLDVVKLKLEKTERITSQYKKERDKAVVERDRAIGQIMNQVSSERIVTQG